MVALYADGIPTDVLAERFGVCRDTVISHVRRADAVPGRVVVLTETDVSTMVAQYGCGARLDQIGVMMHVGARRVRKVLVEEGVSIRVPGRQPSGW